MKENMSRAERRRQAKQRAKLGQPEPSTICDERGHPEQFAALLDGTEPKPCPRCGETPVFGPISQNIDPTLPGYEEL